MDIEKDVELIKRDADRVPKFKKIKKTTKIIADFTEYSPLHKGHRYCMFKAKEKVPDGIFVAVIPGPTERSGRGLPYIMSRYARARAAIAVGADIAVEGPPMGVMGSGQYSLCLAKMFKALNTDYIPRGYKPAPNFNKILKRINDGHIIVPKPYKIIDTTTNEILLEDPLEEDNYVIVSLSKSLGKIGFNFKNKFIFVKRISGVSGTKIRNAVYKGKLESVKDMLPEETYKVLKEELRAGRAPLYRNEEKILENANTLNYEELLNLNLIDEKTAKKLIANRPYKSIKEIEKAIPAGFSTHHKQRILSVLEAKIDKDTISKYIENYPATIRVLGYKDSKTFRVFKNNVPHRRIVT
ncbi:protein of unknown function DUF795 [Methanothermus fervidus DSM 2088]|uniref:Putative cytidyltransferase-related C-terminal region domain-containing protein n=1 Tax=Methanothermus fervidus (strain ATCC 43054 / DSM 2088 / JCM 10308 / V24 S) TaxID=523846 RepID=E3GY73_METFV|nr:nucleotidyltransferase family protein [Methanothermus fervidus]ADP77255.1 protein of unknown function DUF795 [Methanothermus fervidus DSM 2088]